MKQVLYVEDSTTAQWLMRKFLGDVCELTITPSLHKGELACRERKFDLIIADFLFPEGDTLDFIEQIRRDHTVSQLPLIVVSGAMDRVLMTQVLRAGANDAFAKPLDPEQFRATVDRMLRAPYVRSQQHSATGVRCLQWMQGDRVHQFCPELQLTVSAATKEEAAAKMFAALCERAAAGVELGAIAHERIVTHVIES